MTTAIVYYSKHHGNTKKVLDAISELREENNKLREELEILKKEIKGGNVQ